ncbi:succinate dehydrogenase iron-sulfur subunit [bacterium]|nr:MAG: succinate dehydrogenase iron-sulfur subunit [bacterium]RIK64703.1 MAG: succinate dehydrogenase iron-sulfur subunit [Planctomycetota bacterium]
MPEASIAERALATAQTSVRLKIKRQDGPNSKSYWEEFTVPYAKNMNVISALQQVQRNPKTAGGKETAPVVWECNCLEEVCGACTMNINGRVRQACSALIDDPSVGREITLEPMEKFPVRRDLWVDRQRIFKDLKKSKAWINIDGTHDLGPGPRYSEKTQEWRYKLSECMSCGCCMEACPQYTKEGNFIGAAVIGQVVLFNDHPSGKMHAHERIEATMGPGGLTECGNAQNCVEVCPKHIPLTEAIAILGRQHTLHMLRKLFGGAKS